MKRVIYIFLISLIISSIYPIGGWADKPVRLSETKSIIEKSAGLIKRYKGKNLSEANTKILLIEPILEKLGWRVLDPEDVDREYTISPKKIVDYALKIKRPLLFLDVLPLDRSLYDRSFIEKIIGFADEKDVKWVIITNGNEYRLYKTDEKGSIDNKIMETFVIEDMLNDNKGLDKLIDQFTYISRESFERNELDKRAEVIFKERRLNNALNEIVEQTIEELKREKEQLKSADIKKARETLIEIVSDRLAMLERDIEKKEKDVLPTERTEKKAVIKEKDVQILDGTVEEGDKVFHEICFACHGEKGEGDAFGRQFGTDTGQTVGPTLCGGALKNVSNNQLRKIITYGRTTAIVHGIDMPNWGETLSHREIGSIMIYLRKCNEIALERP